MDAHAEFGGNGAGATPVETLLGALGACTAMDVISILVKKRQKVTGYRIEVEGVRAPEGVWPRPFLSLTVRHYLTGENLDGEAVRRAVELSDEKYCSIAATIREGAPVQSEWVIEDQAEVEAPTARSNVTPQKPAA